MGLAKLHFGRVWGSLGYLLNVTWPALGRSWASLGASGAPLGRFLDALGRLLAGLGTVMGAFLLSGAPRASILTRFGTCRVGFGRASFKPSGSAALAARPLQYGSIAHHMFVFLAMFFWRSFPMTSHGILTAPNKLATMEWNRPRLSLECPRAARIVLGCPWNVPERSQSVP